MPPESSPMRERLVNAWREVQANAAYRMRLSRLPYPPLLVSLEATNHCNLRCPMCPVSTNAHNPSVKRGFLDRALFERVARELAAIRPVVVLHMGGESLLHQDLPAMIRRLRDAGLAVRIDTNAMLLTPEVAKALVEADLSAIYVDLDGDGPEEYAAIRERARFERVVENTRGLLDQRAALGRRNPRVIVKNIRYWKPGAKPGFPDSYRALFAGREPDEYRFAWADHWPGRHREDIPEAKRYEVMPADGPYQPCTMLWSRMAIGWDGLVTICCLDLNRTTGMASVAELGVMGAWNSPGMVEARRLHAAGRQAEIDICSNCNQIRRPSARPGLRANWISVSREGGQGGEYKN